MKYSLATLGLAILAAFALSGCESTADGSANRTHEMGGPKSTFRMSDQDMPGHH